ncbi:MAG TPA: S8 family serine peptidase [Thermoanaerobaculia bacterium]|nr:S8 family serine peptidase [Thermoanaerobaculia bacterium]
MVPRFSKIFLFAFAVAILSTATTANAATKSVIVELNGDSAAIAAAKARAAGRPMSAEAIEAHRTTLAAAQQTFLTALAAKGIPFTLGGITIEGTRVNFAYTLVFNGINLVVDPSAVASILAMPQVKAVHNDDVLRTSLDASVNYINAPKVYGALKEVSQHDDFREGYEGQGIYLSVIDSGIQWHHEMFGGDLTPPRLGVLPPSANTNQKIVYYLPLGDLAVEDGLGHGTHVAATAAGYQGFAPGPDGLPLTGDEEPIHGVAPQAKILSYKVCSDALSIVGTAGGPVGGCVSSAITMAIEDSMSPRTVTGFPKPVAHVINMSLGGSGTPDSVTAVAADNAVRLGAVVVAAAGNSGPGPSTAGAPCVGRLVTCVANSIDPHGAWSADVLSPLAFPKTRIGAVTPANTYSAANGTRNVQIIPMSGAVPPAAKSTAQYYVYVSGGETPLTYPATVAGRIALVRTSLQATFGQVANSAALAGAVGVIMRTDTANPTAVKTTIPAAVLNTADFDYLVGLIGLGATPPSGTLSNHPLRLNPFFGNTTMNSSSSRGPVAGYGQVKPDVTAPGTNILAALPLTSLLGALAQSNYGAISGTSMASPHVAGAAVLVKQAHPTWNPDWIRAALANTSTNLRNEAGAPKADGVERTLDQGSGLIDVYEAVNIKALMGVESADINLPSILGSHSFAEVASINARAVVTRSVTVTLRDVSGNGGTYALSVVNNRNLGNGVSAAVSPSSVTVPANGSVTFTATLSVDGNVLTSGDGIEVEWYVNANSSDESLRMPFYARLTQTLPAAAALNAIADDSTPDAEGGVDRDGRYTLNWSYPANELARPCGYRIEESQANIAGTIWYDDAETLTAGGNASWSGADWTSKPHTGTASLGYAAVYIDERTVSMTMTGDVPLPLALITLTFDSAEDIELDFDYGHDDVSTDGGATFTTLATYTGAFTGERVVDLSAFAGRSIRLRFRLVSDQLTSTPVHQGWTVDNIRIRGGATFGLVGTVSGSTTSLAIGGRSNGTYAYRVTALFGNCSSNPFTGTPSNIQNVSVNVATRPPMAAFTASVNPSAVNEPVVFDAGTSADQDNVSGSGQMTYFWSFGDGTTASSTSAAVTHAFTAAGTYRVMLTVIDDDGESASSESMQTVGSGN